MANRSNLIADGIMHLKVPPPVVVLIGLGLLYLGDRQLPSFSLAFPGQISLAIVLLASGLAIGCHALFRFIMAKTTFNPTTPDKVNVLVTNGLYRLSRNPMYVADVLLLLSLAAYYGTLTVAAVVPLFIWYLTEFQIKPEEDHLKSKFGKDYLSYKARVRRWI